MAAVVGIRRNRPAKAVYERMLARGKSKRVASDATMRKIARLCFGVMKNRTLMRKIFSLTFNMEDGVYTYCDPYFDFVNDYTANIWSIRDGFSARIADGKITGDGMRRRTDGGRSVVRPQMLQPRSQGKPV